MPWLSKNGKVRLKNTVTPRKTHAMIEKTICNAMHIKSSKGKYTCKSIPAMKDDIDAWSRLSFLDL